MQLPDPEKSYAGNGEARYKTYEDAVKRALGGINHMYNTGLIWMMWTGTPCILRMVQILHLVRYSFPVVSMLWHLDGRISEVPTLYKVTYHANNGTQATYPNPNMYEENAEVLVLGNETTGFQNEGKGIFWAGLRPRTEQWIRTTQLARHLSFGITLTFMLYGEMSFPRPAP